MWRVRRFTNQASTVRRSILSSRKQFANHESFTFSPFSHPSNSTSVRFLDFYQMGNKDAIEKERARLKDEMSRGYFADMSDLKKNGGKIAMASKTLIPAAVAAKFPSVEVSYSDGKSFKLPIGSDGNVVDRDNVDLPKATLLCLSFRASSQAMNDTWSKPFLNAFGDSKNIHLYEVSFVDSWLLSRNPVKWLLLRMMKKSNPAENSGALQRQLVYSFGDHYYFRKELKILNLLTGYMFLLDSFGRIRWQGYGAATEEELSSLLSSTSLLLEEK
ncbi:uncharacterized protein LOC110699654 isoform X1 [Chenopodium quinoa]|uniref:uncharacterized protein LOC110699654 isoform X1 n=2 Tax=Chenopodium quinoa TaxID=63459 RepID=UPI000B796804|nr:uncharacterized protein LOC110699654 isoform X1 [Chenopodium quinoa]